MRTLCPRHSAIFNNPAMNSPQIQIQQILNPHKIRLHINNRCNSTPKKKRPEKLTLSSAKKIESLYSTISFTTNRRKGSLNDMLKSFDRNCDENIEESMSTIDQSRMKLFKAGQYYRGREQSSNAKRKSIDTKNLTQYFRFEDQPETAPAARTIHTSGAERQSLHRTLFKSQTQKKTTPALLRYGRESKLRSKKTGILLQNEE